MTEMDKKKLQNYLGLTLMAPVLLLFFISEYRHRTFLSSPEESKAHAIIQDVFEELFHGGRWYSGASDEALYGWWLLLTVALFLVWKYRAKFGSLIIRAAESMHAKV